MEKGQIVEFTIEDMSLEGQGIGRVGPGQDDLPPGPAEEAAVPGGMVVFVRDAVAGDRVRARLTKVKKNYAFAHLEEILEPSPWRNEYFDCPCFEQGCGGCAWARLGYDAQLELKQKQVTEKLQRLADLDAPLVRPIIAMEDGDNEGNGFFRYRDKAQFPVSTGGIITRKGGIVENLGDPAVGFYRAKSNEILDCEDCYLQSLAAMAAADALRTFMEEDHITAFDPKWEKGLIRNMIVRTAFATGEVMVLLIINGRGIPNAAKLIEMLDDAIADVGYSLESVVLNINKASGRNVEKNKHKERKDIAVSGELFGSEFVTIAGKPTITDHLGDLEMEISPASFYQVNPVQMERLYGQVRRYVQEDAAADETDAVTAEVQGAAGIEKKPVILDLYCGIGSIGLYCADLAEMVIGIESVKEAVVDANRNAVINGIVNARYLCGKAEQILPRYVDGEHAGAQNKAGRNDTHEKNDRIDEQLQEYIRQADIALLDPPRAGCRPELLEAVAKAGVKRIVYVSCDPATLARDVKVLGQMGYRFIEAVPVDMFPHTGHIETVVCLVNKNAKKQEYVEIGVDAEDYYRIKDSEKER